MKTYTLVTLALVLLSFRLTTQAQSVQPNGLQDRQITRLPIVGANVSQGISRDFLGAPSKHRLQTDLVTGIDSLRMKGSSYPFSTPNGRQRASSPARRMLSPQSQISVIDTAIVRSTVDTTRHVYSFNAKAKMTSDLTQKLTGDLWVDTFRSIITYDANGHMLSWLDEQWSNGQWVNSQRWTSTYDANGNELSLLYEQWSNGQWVNLWRYTYTYDANGNELSLLYEQWSNGQWMNSYRGTSTYDADGRETSYLGESWSNGQWVNIERDTYTYDANGRETSFLNESWSNGQWVNYSRDTYTYDANGNELSLLYEQWSNGQWVNSQRWTPTYDANGNELSLLYEQWPNGQWVNYSRDTYTYDANGNELSLLYEQWSNGQWVNHSRDTYTYDAQENLTSIWFHTWLNSSWTSTDVGEYFGYSVADSAANSYNLGSGYNFTFIRKLIVTGIASQSGNVPAVYSLSQNYPNPFNPTTRIGFEIRDLGFVSLKIYDVLGREVSTLVNEVRQPGSYETTFDAAGLASGVYLYRLEAKDFVSTKKLLLLR